MSPAIHEYLPVEIFSEILLAVCFLDAHDVEQMSSRGQSLNAVRVAITVSSVCKRWRQVVTSIPAFWSNITFRNFQKPSPRDTLACITDILRRSSGRFSQVSLDFRSLLSAPYADRAISVTLEKLLSSALEGPSSSWRMLSITVATCEHMELISDYFLLTTSEPARAKLGAITTLKLVLAPDRTPTTSARYSGFPSRLLPFFDTSYFKNMNCLYLTNVRAVVFPPNLRQTSQLSKRILEVYLEDWTSQIEDTVLIPGSPNSTGGSHNVTKMPPYHLITDSSTNFVNMSFSFALAFTAIFPNQSIEFFTTTLPNTSQEDSRLLRRLDHPPNLPTIQSLARLFLKNRVDRLRLLELKNVTPQAWLALLALLKPLPSSLLLPRDPSPPPMPTLSLEHLVVRFAPPPPRNIRVSHKPQHTLPVSSQPNDPEDPAPVALDCDSEEEMLLCKKIHMRLGFDFEFQSELEKVEDNEDLGSLMMQCLAVLTEDMLPELKTFECYDSQNRNWKTFIAWH
ncbi:hypothetical protein AN958_01684 [Leucoagaricus sp. SymC.cos]|nr:hypothetical protein AN958_01684 [Leucoagaricus sp. SymC.cos]